MSPNRKMFLGIIFVYIPSFILFILGNDDGLHLVAVVYGFIASHFIVKHYSNEIRQNNKKNTVQAKEKF